MLYRSGREESAQEVRARRVLQTSCAEGESFAIASTLLPEVAGCYTATNTEVNDEVFYTETGDVGSGQNIVQAFQPNGDGSDVVWIVAFEASSDTTQENVVYCFSLDLAADVHPADVTSWFCFTNGPDEPDLVSTEEFSTTCDCSSTSEPSTIAPSPSRVSMTLAPSPASREILPSAGPTAASRGMMPSASPTASRGIMPSVSPTAASRGMMPSASPTASRGIMPSVSPSPASPTSSPTSSPSAAAPQVPSSTSSPSAAQAPTSSSAPTSPPSTSDQDQAGSFGHRSITLSASVTVAVGVAATVVHFGL
ncbi:unnamed protein product [Ascophyllum nodosum]